MDWSKWWTISSSHACGYGVLYNWPVDEICTCAFGQPVWARRLYPYKAFLHGDSESRIKYGQIDCANRLVGRVQREEGDREIGFNPPTPQTKHRVVSLPPCVDSANNPAAIVCWLGLQWDQLYIESRLEETAGLFSPVSVSAFHKYTRGNESKRSGTIPQTSQPCQTTAKCTA